MNGIGISHLKGMLEMKDTAVRNSGNTGVYVVGPANANLDDVRLEVNNTSLAAEYGGHIAMQDSPVTGSANVRVLSYLVDAPSLFERIHLPHFDLFQRVWPLRLQRRGACSHHNFR